MILPLTLFAHLAAACAPQVAPKTLAAIARVESGFDPLAIGDNTTRRTIRPSDKGEAIATARRLIGEGHNLDLGLMQINDRNLNWLGLTLDRAFDTCASIRAAADYLMTVSRYNTGSPTRGFRNGYVQKFVRAALHRGIPITHSPAPRPVADTGWRVFGAPAEPGRQAWNVFPDAEKGN